MPRFRFEGVHLQVVPDRLILGLDDPANASLAKLEEIAINVLTDLPQTPISGTGINFGCLEKDPSSELVTLFEFGDTGRLADSGAGVRSPAIKRDLRFGNGRNLNLTLELGSDAALIINANFHSDVSTPDDATAHLEGCVVQLKGTILKLLEDTYDLELT